MRLQPPECPRFPLSLCPKPRSRSRRAFLRGRGWKFWTFVIVGIPLVAGSALLSYYYVTFSRLVDARMHGEFERTDPRIFARPLTIHRGQRITRAADDRSAERSRLRGASARRAGRRVRDRPNALVVIPRSGDRAGQTIRFGFAPPARRRSAGPLPTIESVYPKRQADRGSIAMDAPLLTALIEGREKRRDVPLAAIAPHMTRAVIAIEDHRFYEHSGVDVIGTTRAVVTNMFGSRKYLSGGSTITQQLVRNTFLSVDVGPRQGARARRARRREAQVHRVVHVGGARAAAVEGQDPRAVSERRLPRAARIVRDSRRARGRAAVLRQGRQQPDARRGRDDRRRDPVARGRFAVSARRSREGATQRRAAGHGRLPATSAPTPPSARRQEPVQIVAARARFRSALLRRLPDAGAAGAHQSRGPGGRLLDARPAPAADRAGRRPQRPAESRRSCWRSASRATRRPRSSPSIRAPERSSRWSAAGPTTNRSSTAPSPPRQPGSTFKPFVYLAAFERALADGRTDITPATVVVDEPTVVHVSTIRSGRRRTTRTSTTARSRCATRSRTRQNIATIKVAESIGFDNVAGAVAQVRHRHAADRVTRRLRSACSRRRRSKWRRPTRCSRTRRQIRPLRALSRIVSAGKDLPLEVPATKTVARKDTTFLVTNMMRSVTERRHGGVGARERLHARRRRQDGHDERPARRVVYRLHARSSSPSCGSASTTISRSA